MFYLKTCESSNLIYVVIGSIYNEEHVSDWKRENKASRQGTEFIHKISVHRNINNLNVRNTFELVEEEISKYSLLQTTFAQ